MKTKTAEQIFIFVYTKDNQVKAINEEQSRNLHNILLDEGWNHAETLDACVYIEYKYREEYASQPMSAEPTVQQLREVAKNNPDTFLAGALYVIDNYKLNSPLMSAGQVGRKIFYVNEVRDLIRLYDKEEISLSKFVEILNEKSTGLSAIELFKLKNQKKENSTAPTVKAEGWVSVEEVFTYEDMMDIAGWMAAADNKRPISELKYEAEMYIKTKLAARQPTPTIPTRQ